MPAAINLTGMTFDRLTVIDRATVADNRAHWNCRCACGVILTVRAEALRSGNTRSCGCLKQDANRRRALVLGSTNTPEYRCWKAMRRRCEYRTEPSFPRYGGRGIHVCDRWRHSFANFLTDMGPCPSDQHSLDRIDNNGPYAPENCRWATIYEQANNMRSNRRLTWKGRTQTVAQWAHECGIPPATVYDRLRKHWPLEHVFSRRRYHPPTR